MRFRNIQSFLIIWTHPRRPLCITGSSDDLPRVARLSRVDVSSSFVLDARAARDARLAGGMLTQLLKISSNYRINQISASSRRNRRIIASVLRAVQFFCQEHQSAHTTGTPVARPCPHRVSASVKTLINHRQCSNERQSLHVVEHR
eukprot:SAG11_NODE_84_length_17377_cov_78.572578_9_plen_146_part_00